MSNARGTASSLERHGANGSTHGFNSGPAQRFTSENGAVCAGSLGAAAHCYTVAATVVNQLRPRLGDRMGGEPGGDAVVSPRSFTFRVRRAFAENARYQVGGSSGRRPR